MAPRRLNPRLAKLNRPYTVEEVARLYGVDRNTVRNWIKAGLERIDDVRPFLIQGRSLRAFLTARRASAKRPCPPGTIYCCKCRQPRRPAIDFAEYARRENGAGNLKAFCSKCETVMHRRTREQDIAAILPGIEVRITEAE